MSKLKNNVFNCFGYCPYHSRGLSCLTYTELKHFRIKLDKIIFFLFMVIFYVEYANKILGALQTLPKTGDWRLFGLFELRDGTINLSKDPTWNHALALIGDYDQL